MHISRVIIKNWRNLENVDVKLSEKAIIFGENGAGKSNFLTALRLVLDPSYRIEPNSDDFPFGMPKFRGTEIEIRIQFSGFTQSDDNLKAALGGCFIPGDDSVAQIGYLYRPRKNYSPVISATTQDSYEGIRFGGTFDSEDQIDLKAAAIARKHIKLDYIDALRDIEKDLRSWSTSPLRVLVEQLKLPENVDFKDVAQKVSVATDDLRSIKDIKTLQQGIKDRLSDAIGTRYAFAPEIAFLPSNPEELQKSILLLAENSTGIGRASLGLANVLYLILFELRIEKMRTPILHKEEFSYSLLAVEEPESHLHPHLQRLIFQDFIRRDTPILLSTHSPNIASISEPDWYVSFRKKQDKLQVISTSQCKQLTDEEKQDIQRLIDVTHGEIVFSRGCIFVEGYSEEFLLPEISRKMKKGGKLNYSLDNAGISVINIRGTDFLPYVKFFGPNGLDLPMVFLTDGDIGEGVEKKLEVLKTQNLVVLDDASWKNLLDEIKEGEFANARKLLEDNKVYIYAGLKRGINIARELKHDTLHLKSLYDSGRWDELKKQLALLGIFVNDATFEVELIKSGYGDDMVDIYKNLGASDAIAKNMNREIIQAEYQKVIRRIEGTGFGKGRFALRLVNRIDANRVPAYITNAFEFIINRT
jgi:putative ATP-dependent endonuclease of OLD family